jgi:hypothetical protein
MGEARRSGGEALGDMQCSDGIARGQGGRAGKGEVNGRSRGMES